MKTARNKKNIICSNVHYFYYDTKFFFKKMQEYGLSRIELYLGTPHIFIDGNVIDDFAGIPQLAEEYGIEIMSVHPETISLRYNLCNLDEQWNQKSLEAYKNCIKYASLIRAKSVNTNITGAFRDFDNKKIFERVAENLKELILYGEEKGIYLTLDTESLDEEGFISSLTQMKNLDECIGNSKLHFGLNMGALNAANETVAEWEKIFRNRIEYIRYTSVSDFLNTEKDHFSLRKKDYDSLLFFDEDCYLDRPFDVDCYLSKVIKNGTNKAGTDCRNELSLL